MRWSARSISAATSRGSSEISAGDADAGAEPVGSPLGGQFDADERDRVAHLRRDLQRRGLVDVQDERRELVAADPPEHVAGAQARTQRAVNPHQRVVAGGVAPACR